MSDIPELPINIDPNLFAWGTKMQQYVEQLIGTASPPPQVGGVGLRSVAPGVFVNWNQAANAASYIILRNTSVDPANAATVIQLFGADNISYFDVTAQYATGTTLYYWVQAVNGVGQGGPLSNVMSVAAP